MKAFPLALIVVSISIICILNISLVSALDQGEISVSPSWTTGNPYQGQSTAVKLFLTSNSAEQIKIYYIGLNFDWMPADSFIGLDLSDDPVVVPATGIYIFDPMAIQIPANVSAGSHSYFIGIDGIEGSYDSFSWNSPSFTLQILDSRSKIYDSLLTQVNNNISRAVSAGYQSAEAQSLLAQAQNERDEAVTLAADDNWAGATSILQSAFSNLEQAEAAEQLYAEQQAGLQTILLIVAVIVVIVVISIIAVVMRKRRKQPAAVVDQPVDQTPETQDSTPE